MLCFLAFTFYAVASAEVLYDGSCPEVNPVENFDFSAYQGIWYEIARFPNRIEEDNRGKCTQTEYTVDGNKGIMKNSHVINGVRSYAEGEITLSGPAQLMFTYTFGGVTKSQYMTVLDTDYKNYAIGYHCKNSKETNKHQVFSWIFSREKTLEGAAKETVENYLNNVKAIDTEKFVSNDHSPAACKANVNRHINRFLY